MSAGDFVSTGASSAGDDDVNTEDAFEKIDDLLSENKIIAPTKDAVEAWVSAVQKLLKGKVQMNREVNNVDPLDCKKQCL